METEKAIAGRRSVRAYEKKPIPEEMIQKLLKAGAMAPSAMDKQPCRFIVIEDRAKMDKIASAVKDRLGVLGIGARLIERAKVMEDVIFYGAQLLILLVADKDDWAPIDCALAAQNMMLQGYDMGLGSCFIGFMTTLDEKSEILKELGISEKQKLYCPLIFGFPKNWPDAKNREAKIQKRIRTRP